ncbi:mitochondrial carrier family protein [Striga asiatica]|uniref:Mitochondrial carrier family protein n=1 Tax=Striga asiatica TaxID=4170 RepID=A0A5A7QH99_STRAF|nr:mitochondrial carrier family protein [Striga asiatica]
MEGPPTAVCRGIRGYWRRKGYERLNAGLKRKPRAVQLAPGGVGGDGSTRRRRFWRVKLAPPRLKLRLRFSPKKVLVRLRDAYVSMMMKLASSRAIGGGYCGGYPASGFGARPLKEYDERMIVEIYKSIVLAHGQLVPRDAAWIGSEISCRR